MKNIAPLLLSLMILAPAVGQDRSGPIVVGESGGIEKELLGRQKALLIGIDSYTGFPALPNCVLDCKAIAEILRESHREFLRKVNQAELCEAVESAQQGERATILDPAVPPTQPTSSPLKMLVVLIVGTFGAAGGVAVLLELIDSVIVSDSELEQRYRMPVLGSIPKMS